MPKHKTDGDREHIRTIFIEAYKKTSPQERSQYLDRACGADVALRAELDSLLDAHAGSSGFLESPAFVSDSVPDMSPISEGPGTVIGRYKLLERIGEGGMAVVYMAEQAEPIRRRVALKIIKLGMDTKSVIARFEAERQALAMMDHPNIAKVFDAGATETGRPYFVMELVTGVSITEYCDKNSLGTKERLGLFIQICNAVQHAHEKGVVHRDIKPSNVMVAHHDGKPVPKVIDFGIAKATNQRLTEKTLFTRYAHIIGTPAYMSPEQAELSELGVDTRSDVYSLGVLLYELLTGTTPFSEEELRQAGYLEMQRIIREEEPARPSTKLTTLGETLADIARRRGCTPDLLARAVRGDLDWIVMKALEKDRARRYEGVADLAVDLQRHLENRPVAAHAPSAAYRLRKFLRRNRVPVAVAAAVLTVACVVVISFVWSQRQVRLTEAESAKHVNALGEARRLVTEKDLTGARQILRPILESRHVGLEARILFRRIMDREPEEDSRLEAIRNEHYRERVQYYTARVQEDPADPNNYLRRAQQYHRLHEEENVHADMSRYATVLGQGWFSRLRFGTPSRLSSVVTGSSRYRVVLSMERREDGIVVASIAFGQKGRSTMKPFEIPMVLTSVFVFCLFPGIDGPPLYADVEFGEPVNLRSVVPLIDPAHESINCISSNGLEMYIESDRPGGQGSFDIWLLRRSSVNEDWGAPENLGQTLNTPYRENSISISADGLTLLFTSTRTGGYGGQDIYVATRPTRDSPWGQAVNMGPRINSSAHDYCPWMLPGGLELYFASARAGGYGSCDVYVTRRVTTDGSWGEPENLGSVVNSVYFEAVHSVSPDGRLLFFCGAPSGSSAPRPGGYGGADIWMTRRRSLSEPWQTPVNLGPTVNSFAHELIPRISPDASTLYFSTLSGGVWENWLSAILPVVDFNGDDTVDGDDLAILADCWGKDEGLCDIGPYAWGDGVVDGQDLAVLGEYMDVTGPAVGHAPLSYAVEVACDVNLVWTPAESAETHDVYFGTSFEDVNLADRALPLGVLVSQGQDANTFDPSGLLEYDQTYYWRIDEVGAGPDPVIYRGFVWSFTIKSLLVPVEDVVATASSAFPGVGPEKTVDGSGLDANDLHSAENEDMWLSTPEGPQPTWIEYEFEAVCELHRMLVWNYNLTLEPVLGYGFRDVTVEYSEDGSGWTVLGDFEFAMGTGTRTYGYNTTVDFGGVSVKCVRLTALSNWGGLTPPRYGLSEVRFLQARP